MRTVWNEYAAGIYTISFDRMKSIYYFTQK